MKMNRRKFLRQIGLGSSACLLNAIAGQLHVHAAAPADLERCLLVNVHGNNMWPRLSRPINVQSATDWDFANALSPLSAMQDKVIHAQNLYNPGASGVHGNYRNVLSVSSSTDKEIIGGISIDRKIALDLNADVPFRSLNFGHYYGIGLQGTNSNVSGDGVNQPYPSISDPQQILSEVFGLAADNSALESAAKEKSSLLDAMREDISRMQTRLAPEERAMLDQYLTSVRELEIQTELLQARVCEPPTPFEIPERGDMENIIPEAADFYYKAAATALSCGLTRVVTIAHEGVGHDPLQPLYPFLDINVSAHGPLSHRLGGLSEDNDAGWAAKQETVDQFERLYNWRAQGIVDFFEIAGQSPLGSETLADRTLMIWLNSGGGIHHNGLNSINGFLIGNPDGVLKSGQQHKFGHQERTIGDLFTTAAQAMGLPLQEFGLQSQGAMTEFLA